MSEEDRSFGKRIERLFSKHWLAILVIFCGAIASIIGVLVAVYFGIWPVVPKRELTYSVLPLRTAFERGPLSDLSFNYQGKPVTGDITVAQIAISNAGSLAIRHEDIITMPTIIVPAPILGVSTNVPAIRGTCLILDTNKMAEGRVGLDWNILENADRPVIQIVYEGKRDVPIRLDGRTAGQAQPKKVEWVIPQLLTWYRRKMSAFCLSGSLEWQNGGATASPENRCWSD